jgi:sugar lactone lactonase YvrE
MKTVAVRIYDLFRVVFLASAILGCACSDRPRSNPLDPENPYTEGKPTGLSAYSEKHTVTLYWDKIGLKDLTSYGVYRRGDGETRPVLLRHISADSNRIHDKGLPYDSPVTYWITSVAGDYESPLSDSVSITPGPRTYWVVDYYVSSLTRLSYDAVHTIFTNYYDIWPIDVDLDTLNGSAWLVFPMGYLLEVTLSGENIRWIQGLDEPDGITVDAQREVMWIRMSDRTELHRFNLEADMLDQLTDFQEIADLALNPVSGEIWVADMEGGRLSRYTWEGLQNLTVDSDLTAPVALAYDPDLSQVWVGDGSLLKRVDEQGGVVTITELEHPVKVLAADPVRSVCWALLESESDYQNVLIRVDAAGNVLSRTDGFLFACGLAVNPDNGECLVADTWNGRVVRLNSGGDIIAVNRAFVEPWAIIIQ